LSCILLLQLDVMSEIYFCVRQMLEIKIEFYKLFGLNNNFILFYIYKFFLPLIIYFLLLFQFAQLGNCFLNSTFSLQNDGNTSQEQTYFNERRNSSCLLFSHLNIKSRDDR
jgi:hypothetical protein